MELVLVERKFEEPVGLEDVEGAEDAGAQRLGARHVRLVKTLLSRDRRRMLRVYEAPDAETARFVEEQSSASVDRAWTCSHLPNNHHTGGQAQAAEIVVVERRFPEPIAPDFFVTVRREKGWCLDLYRTEHVESYLATDGLRMVCVFRAPDAESVRLVNTQTGVPYTSVWTASIR